MAALQDKAIRYGSLVTVSHEADQKRMIISDGFVDTSLHLMKPRKTSSQSLVRGLFVILPPLTNELKVSGVWPFAASGAPPDPSSTGDSLRRKPSKVCPNLPIS
jgi:hypothetical protein